MKNPKTVLLLLCVVFTCCNRYNPRDMANKAQAITKSSWVLQHLKTPEASITLERPLLEMSGKGDVYIIHFDEQDQLTGTTASSHYTAVYSLNEDSSISIGPVSVIPAKIARELPVKEEVFFEYLKKMSHWSITETGQMQLFSPGYAGNDWAVMVFSKY